MKVLLWVVLFGTLAFKDVAGSECNLMVGDGEGDDEIWIGYLSRAKCIRACIKRKFDHDDSINGVTVYASPQKAGCYCEKGMRYRDTGDTAYKSCFLVVPDFNANKVCKLYVGNGKGTDWVRIDDLPKDKCIAACIKRKRDIDDSITGVTIYTDQTDLRCYCEKGMTYRNDDTDRKSCFLRVSDPFKNIPCKLFIGNGKSGDWFKIKGLPAKECIKACIKRKNEVDDSINGVTIFTDPTDLGCYCEKHMTHRNDNSNRQSCFLRVHDKIEERCKLFHGEAEGGDEESIGNLPRKQCIQKCIERKRTVDDSINGVSVPRNPAKTGCWCAQGMRWRDDSDLYDSCLFRV